MKLGVSYFGVRAPELVQRDLEEIVSAGCNLIVHTFSENDLLFYHQTMREIVQLSHDQGLEVYLDPWGVGGVFGGEAFSAFVMVRTEDRQVLSDGRLAPAACPNSRGFREFMKEWVSAALETGADGIFWDEPHFYEGWLERAAQPFIHGGGAQWACKCESCQELFRDKYGQDIPQRVEDERLKIFREESIFSFLKELMDFAKALGGRNALCLMPQWNDKEGQLQRWERYLELESLDVFGTDPYWIGHGKRIDDFLFYVRGLKCLCDAYDKEAQIWVQVFKIGAGDEDKVARSIEIAHREGITNICAWGYRGSAYMSAIRCDDPGLVWQKLKEVYKIIRSGAMSY